jgi:hypothetical protein
VLAERQSYEALMEGVITKLNALRAAPEFPKGKLAEGEKERFENLEGVLRMEITNIGKANDVLASYTLKLAGSPRNYSREILH